MGRAQAKENRNEFAGGDKVGEGQEGVWIWLMQTDARKGNKG